LLDISCNAMETQKHDQSSGTGVWRSACFLRLKGLGHLGA
jgi:hypothetical protein